MRSMHTNRPIISHANLPEAQQSTQRLVDQFNADERLWTKLDPLRRLRRALFPRMSRSQRKAQDLADFARAASPKDCIAQQHVGGVR